MSTQADKALRLGSIPFASPGYPFCRYSVVSAATGSSPSSGRPVATGDSRKPASSSCSAVGTGTGGWSGSAYRSTRSLLPLTSELHDVPLLRVGYATQMSCTATFWNRCGDATDEDG